MPETTLYYSIDRVVLYPLCKYISKIFCKNIHPNMITLANCILSAGIIYYLYYINHNNINITNNMKYLVVSLVVLRTFLDALDGTVARMYNKQTKFGGIFDSVSDSLAAVSFLIIIYFISKPFCIFLLSIAIVICMSQNIRDYMHDNTLLAVPMICVMMFMIQKT